MLKKFRQEQPNIINQEFKEDRDRKRRIADKITSENVKKTKPCKVVCFGVICQDRILRIDEYPEPDWHCRLKKEGTFPGGEALNTSVALARWGIRTRLVGNLIGADEEARNISLIPVPTAMWASLISRIAISYEFSGSDSYLSSHSPALIRSFLIAACGCILRFIQSHRTAPCSP